jgi:hypothetical protein
MNSEHTKCEHLSNSILPSCVLRHIHIAHAGIVNISNKEKRMHAATGSFEKNSPWFKVFFVKKISLIVLWKILQNLYHEGQIKCYIH